MKIAKLNLALIAVLFAASSAFATATKYTEATVYQDQFGVWHNIPSGQTDRVSCDATPDENCKGQGTISSPAPFLPEQGFGTLNP